MTAALPSLFDLSSSARAARDALDALDGNDEQREAELLALLDAIGGDLTAKADEIAAVLAELESRQHVYATQAERFEAKATAVAKKRERLTAYLGTCLEAAGAQKVIGQRFTVALRQNPPHVQVLDETLLPPDAWRHPAPVVDKAGLLRRLKDREVVPGAALVAGGTRVEVR